MKTERLAITRPVLQILLKDVLQTEKKKNDIWYSQGREIENIPINHKRNLNQTIRNPTLKCRHQVTTC